MSIRLLVSSLVLITLAGCSAIGGTLGQRSLSGTAATSCLALNDQQELVLNLSQEMVDEGRLHAALANLEQLPTNVAEVRLRKARILRLLDEPEAKNLYTSLIDTCLEAGAQHGLGQIAAAEANYREASGHLRMAVRLDPANDDIRNDLGVVYLHLRRLDEARFELLTALELDESNMRSLENLLTLLIYQDSWKQASDLVSSKSLSPEQFQAAEVRARKLLEEDSTGAAALLTGQVADQEVQSSQ